VADGSLRATEAQRAEAYLRIRRGHEWQPGFGLAPDEDGLLYLATDALDDTTYYALDAEGKVVQGPGSGA